ncbi:MAG: GAF domain-containing serine/threonine-protein kinase [Actinomycetota bacterium]|nr:GAF domain-containing serine/threonine-protein kinase [Actinomycetota bacterium]
MTEEPTGGHLAALSERYVVGRRLGQGDRAAVYQATDLLLRRQVVIKVFASRADSAEELLRQEAEAKLLASLNHYAVTTLLDAGVDTVDPVHPQVYLVMEYVPGDDLRERLRNGRIPWVQVCWLGHDLSEGLHAVHELGFLHRDIKPANILVAARNADARFRGKLTDFRLAALSESGGTGRFSSPDPATYISPEQVEGAPATIASDVYSLGLVLLEAGTGQPAFPGSSEQSLLARVRHVPTIPDSVPPAVGAILRSMTARQPEHRISLVEAAAQFQDANIDELVRQRRVGPPLVASDEAQRLAAVRRYNVLDTPPEPSYDRVTRLVARTLRVAIAAIGIFDVDRVWVKSRHGIDVEELDSTGIASPVGKPDSDPWMVRDTLLDTETSTSPLVTYPPHVRSFAAAPLITYDGHPIGALYAADLAPRDFTATELASLRDFAGIAMNEMELRLATRKALFERK